MIDQPEIVDQDRSIWLSIIETGCAPVVVVDATMHADGDVIDIRSGRSSG